MYKFNPATDVICRLIKWTDGYHIIIHSRTGRVDHRLFKTEEKARDYAQQYTKAELKVEVL